MFLFNFCLPWKSPFFFLRRRSWDAPCAARRRGYLPSIKCFATANIIQRYDLMLIVVRTRCGGVTQTNEKKKNVMKNLWQVLCLQLTQWTKCKVKFWLHVPCGNANHKCATFTGRFMDLSSHQSNKEKKWNMNEAKCRRSWRNVNQIYFSCIHFQFELRIQLRASRILWYIFHNPCYLWMFSTRKLARGLGFVPRKYPKGVLVLIVFSSTFLAPHTHRNLFL